MTAFVRRLLAHPRLAALKGAILRFRGLVFVGRRYECPCCGASLRGFVGRWGFLRTTPGGYCPRCNAKARHRRVWRYLEASADIAAGDRVLEIAPWPSLASAFRNRMRIDYVGLDLQHAGPHVTVIGDAAAMPFRPAAFDLVVCMHVLEHVADDRSAIDAMFDVVKPGGSAVVSVPLQFDRPTHEDPSITEPEERARVFGERSHVRAYGLDLVDRLTASGFRVDLDLATDIPAGDAERFGLRDDEHIFRCWKPVDPASPPRR